MRHVAALVGVRNGYLFTARKNLGRLCRWFLRKESIYQTLLLASLLNNYALATSTAAAEEPELKASINKAQATPEDTLVFTVKLILPEAYKLLEIPQFADKIEGFRIIDVGSDSVQELKPGIIEKSRQLNLKADISGSYVLPGIALSYKDMQGSDKKLETPEIFVEIKAEEIATGEGAQIKDENILRDIKNLSPLPRSYLMLILTIATILCILAGSLLLYFLIKKRRAKPKPLIPAHEEALLALDILAQQDAPGQYKEFYFALSQILRHYVERQYQLQATDQTLEEIRSSIGSIETLSSPLQEELLNILGVADMVKFANLIPGNGQNMTLLEQSKSFVEKTKPVEEAKGEVL